MMKLTHLLAGLILAGGTLGYAGDWTQWRGPEQSGVSREKGLPEKWDPDTGENVLWTANAGGMSSPIVMNGKVYTWTRIGEVPSGDGPSATFLAGPQTQEVLVCLDKATGKQLWEHRESMTQTDVPFHRLGWGNVVGDPKTGRVYGYGTQGRMVCLDGESGKLIWSRHMTEEFGVISTFGGRTPSPALDGDQILFAMVAFGWGDQSQGQHRLFALNKETGELNWSAGTGGRPVDAPYNTPVIANINGVRQVMFAAGDGGVHSFQVRTGKHMWSYKASKRGLNSSVVVEGERVFVTHSEENVDTPVMGRVVCLDVSGDTPKEVWRTDAVEAGFASPTLGNGMLYVMDNGGAVHALDVSTGKSQWRKRVDSIGKASLVFADGKLYVPGANGNFVILRPGAKKADVLSKVELTEKLGREYTIFGSVAVSDGKIFLQAANKMFCIGDKNAAGGAASGGGADPIPEKAAEDAAGTEAAWLQVVPADVLLRPGEKATFSIRTFDAKGIPVTVTGTPKWNIDQLVIPPPPHRAGGYRGYEGWEFKGDSGREGLVHGRGGRRGRVPGRSGDRDDRGERQAGDRQGARTRAAEPAVDD